MMQPRWQAWVASPPRFVSSSAWASPLILDAPSNWPCLKLKVGYPPASFSTFVRTLVPNAGSPCPVTACRWSPSANALAAALNCWGCLRAADGRARLVEDDRLHLLRAHHGAHAAAAAVTRRAELTIRAGDRGGAQLHLAGLPDGHVRHLVAVLLPELLDGVVVAEHPQAVVHGEPDTALVDHDLPQVVARGLSLEDDREVAETGHRLRRLAAGVRLLDPAGERALAADRQPPTRRRARSSEQPRREHELVGRAERVTQGVNLLRDDRRRQAATAEPGVVADRLDRRLRPARRTHVDSQDLVHVLCLSFREEPVHRSNGRAKAAIRRSQRGEGCFPGTSSSGASDRPAGRRRRGPSRLWDMSRPVRPEPRRRLRL